MVRARTSRRSALETFPVRLRPYRRSHSFGEGSDTVDGLSITLGHRPHASIPSIGDVVSDKILILTDADDIHAISVASALSMRGVEATLWPTADFPTRAEETLHFGQSLQSSFRVEGVGFSLLDP